MPAKLLALSSINVSSSNYQPGGTFLSIVGCYALQVVTFGSNSIGFGHWKYHKLVGKNSCQYIIASTYQVELQRPQTMYTQRM